MTGTDRLDAASGATQSAAGANKQPMPPAEPAEQHHSASSCTVFQEPSKLLKANRVQVEEWLESDLFSAVAEPCIMPPDFEKPQPGLLNSQNHLVGSLPRLHSGSEYSRSTIDNTSSCLTRHGSSGDTSVGHQSAVRSILKTSASRSDMTRRSGSRSIQWLSTERQVQLFADDGSSASSEGSPCATPAGEAGASSVIMSKLMLAGDGGARARARTLEEKLAPLMCSMASSELRWLENQYDVLPAGREGEVQMRGSNDLSHTRSSSEAWCESSGCRKGLALTQPPQIPESRLSSFGGGGLFDDSVAHALRELELSSDGLKPPQWAPRAVSSGPTSFNAATYPDNGPQLAGSGPSSPSTNCLIGHDFRAARHMGHAVPDTVESRAARSCQEVLPDTRCLKPCTTSTATSQHVVAGSCGREEVSTTPSLPTTRFAAMPPGEEAAALRYQTSRHTMSWEDAAALDCHASRQPLHGLETSMAPPPASSDCGDSGGMPPAANSWRESGSVPTDSDCAAYAGQADLACAATRLDLQICQAPPLSMAPPSTAAALSQLGLPSPAAAMLLWDGAACSPSPSEVPSPTVFSRLQPPARLDLLARPGDAALVNDSQQLELALEHSSVAAAAQSSRVHVPDGNASPEPREPFEVATHFVGLRPPRRLSMLARTFPQPVVFPDHSPRH